MREHKINIVQYMHVSTKLVKMDLKMQKMLQVRRIEGKVR